MRFSPVFSCFLAIAFASDELYRVRTNQVSVLTQHISSHYSLDQVDILSHQRRLSGDEVLLKTTPTIIADIQNSLIDSGFESARPESILKVVSEERRELDNCHDKTQVDVILGKFSKSNFFSCFWKAPEVFNFLDQMTRLAGSSMTKFQISQTLEGRSIPAFKVSSGSTSKPIIFIQGMLHAREWISPPTVIYTMAALLDGLHNNEPKVLSVLKAFDFVFVPIVNVSSYMVMHIFYSLTL